MNLTDPVVLTGGNPAETTSASEPAQAGPAADGKAAPRKSQPGGRSPTPLSQQVLAGLVSFMDFASVILAAAGVNALPMASRQSGEILPVPGVVVLAAAVLCLALNAAGLYRFPAITSPARHVTRMILTSVGVAFGLVAAGIGLLELGGFSRNGLVAWLSATVAFLIGFRFVVAVQLRRLAEKGRIGRRIVIYGAGPQGERLINRIVGLNEPWNQIVGVYDDRITRIGASIAGYPIAGGLAELIRHGQRHRPDEVLIALPWGAEGRILEVLHGLAVLPSNVRLAPEFQRFDLIQGRTNSQFGLPMVNAYEKPVEGWGRIWKRLFDFALSSAVVLLAAPVMLVIALLIRLESPGPVLFRQPRYGFNNKLIEVYKFRTMRSETCDRLGDQLTRRGDERVTRLGAFLRRTSLDEMPQLLNVLRSEMSLVGPRPHAIRTTAGGKQCDEVVDHYAVRHKVKPGITGWAQVNGWRGTMETEEHLVKRLEHDLHYINNWSPLFDIKILLMTVWAVLNGRNSY